MYIVVIGSRALARRYGDFRYTSSSDYDYIAEYETIEAYRKIREMNGSVTQEYYTVQQAKKVIYKYLDFINEFEIAWTGSLIAELVEYIKKDPETEIREDHALKCSIYGPSLDVLYTLKMSHRYLRNSPHFLKTMNDIRWMRSKGAKIPEELKDWLVRRERETYTYKHPSLQMNKKEFFSGDQVQYIYDHDSLHRAMATFGRDPTYTLYQKEGSEVQCDKSKWDALPHDIKLRGVLEEAYVLALERSQIPFNFVPNPTGSFNYALEKICTSITSGWFREFAWEHYNEVIELFRTAGEYDYVNRFREGLTSGIVKPHQNK